MIANIILAVSGLILLVLCMGVYLSNPKRAVNRALSAFLLSGFLWVLANFFANISTTKGEALFFSRATLIGGVLSPLTFLIFVATYTRYRKVTKAYLAGISALPLLAVFLTFTNLNISSADIHGTNVVAGPIYILLIVIILSYIPYGIYRLVKFHKIASSTERAQLQYIYAGVALTIGPAIITNVLLPIFGSSESSAIGPASVVAISVFMAIAIVRHQLLDIRLVVARSLAYVLVLGTLAATFALVLLTITSIFFSDSNVTTGIKIIYISIALLLAFIYQPLKKVFDRLTNRLFYQDAYDPQKLIDELNKDLVGNIELKKLLEKSSATIAENIKAEYCLFGIRETEDMPVRIFGTTNKVFPSGQMELVRQMAPSFNKQKVILTDVLENKQENLRSILHENSVGMLVRLIASSGAIGYIFLGYKKSGNPYSEQDVRIMDIISDELVIAIQNSLRFEEIKRFNVTLQEKIEEATKELKRVNSRLRELDKTKDEFISMASHQLRTPLTAVKGYLSMILEGDTGKVSKSQQEYTQKAFDGAQKMVYLIADMLNVSRLQTGKFVIENKPTDLVQLVQGEVSQLESSAAEHKIKLDFHKPDKLPLLNLDETKIRQVVMNFTDNAIYYTPGGGSVTVELSASDKEVTFTVTDTGLGVPASVQHHLFSKFYRADNARKVRPDGTGLGLFMAKKVIVAQGGAIIFKSIEGKGSTFGFSFPRNATEFKGGTVEKVPQKQPAASESK